jgi:hypothetical protein
MQGLRVRVDVWADEVLADLFGKLCAASATDADSAIHESRQFLHIQVQAQAQAGPGRGELATHPALAHHKHALAVCTLASAAAIVGLAPISGILLAPMQDLIRFIVLPTQKLAHLLHPRQGQAVLKREASPDPARTGA